MISRHFPAPLAGDGDVVECQATRFGQCLRQLQRSTGRRVFLVHVMHFGHGNVEIGRQRVCNLPQCGIEDCDSTAHVAVVDDGNVRRHGIQSLQLAVVEAGNSADERNPGVGHDIEDMARAVRQAEINQYVGRIGQ